MTSSTGTAVDTMWGYTESVVTFFAVWAVLSTAYQFDVPWLRNLFRFDVFSLVPLWTFFAPRPGQTDYHLLYRDRLIDESTTDWQELEMADRRTFYSSIWNPDKRSKKVLTDVVQILVDIAVTSDNDSAVLVFSTPYVLILNVVMSQSRDGGATQRQFVIAETSGYVTSGDPHLVIKSGFHRFTAAADKSPALTERSRTC